MPGLWLGMVAPIRDDDVPEKGGALSEDAVFRREVRPALVEETVLRLQTVLEECGVNFYEVMLITGVMAFDTQEKWLDELVNDEGGVPHEFLKGLHGLVYELMLAEPVPMVRLWELMRANAVPNGTVEFKSKG